MRWTKTPLDRFTDKYEVDPASGCWIWTACINQKRHGYGMFSIDSKAVWAHRAGYELLVGPIPEGLVLDHLCRNPPCVNPDHLEPVTQKVNMHRSEAPSVIAWRSGVCQRGHDMAGDNAYVKPNGHRFCRQCNADAKARTRSESPKVPCWLCGGIYKFDNLVRHLRRVHGQAVSSSEVRDHLERNEEA